MKKLDVVAAALVMIGALNWGLAGVFHLDLVASVFGMSFGETSALSERGLRPGRLVRPVPGFYVEIDSAPLVRRRGGRPRMKAGQIRESGFQKE